MGFLRKKREEEGNDDQNERDDEDGNGASVEEREGVVPGRGEEKEDGQEKDAEENEAGKNEMPLLLTEPKVRKLANKTQRTTQATKDGLHVYRGLFLRVRVSRRFTDCRKLKMYLSDQ